MFVLDNYQEGLVCISMRCICCPAATASCVLDSVTVGMWSMTSMAGNSKDVISLALV